VLFVYGARPEAIKMAPLIRELDSRRTEFDVKVCLTGQHREMLDQMDQFFGLNADFDLDLMEPDQSIHSFISRCLERLQPIIAKSRPSIVILQGDTNTVLAGALSAFYEKVPIAHLEAGLRTGNKYMPFPEEINRRIASHIADYHFAPTKNAVDNLRKEGITENVYLVGNTIVDALYLTLSIINSKGDREYQNFFSFLDFSKKLILITGHRRESFGEGLSNVCSAVKAVAETDKDVQFIYPVHPNPRVRETVYNLLGNINNVFLIEPLDYPNMVWLMSKSYFIITDSGGIQEEAPALRKPLLVTRSETERKEVIDEGVGLLAGTDKKVLTYLIEQLLYDNELYDRMQRPTGIYGDGTAAKKIASILSELAL